MSSILIAIPQTFIKEDDEDIIINIRINKKAKKVFGYGDIDFKDFINREVDGHMYDKDLKVFYLDRWLKKRGGR